MDRKDVSALMASSKSEAEWNTNCGKVKNAFNGYPDFWWGDIICSGLLEKTQKKYGW